MSEALATEQEDGCFHTFNAEYDEQGVYFYQAFRPEIAEYAVQHQRFGGPFWKPQRMTWIKPSFAWMLYRSGYASKKDQTCVLKVKVPHETVAALLANCSCKHGGGGSKGRVQWDPERDLFEGDDGLKSREPRKMLNTRSIQIGLSRELSEMYVEGSVEIQDVSSLARRVGKAHRTSRLGSEVRAVMGRDLGSELPSERPYVPRLPPQELVRLQIDASVDAAPPDRAQIHSRELATNPHRRQVDGSPPSNQFREGLDGIKLATPPDGHQIDGSKLATPPDGQQFDGTKLAAAPDRLCIDSEISSMLCGQSGKQPAFGIDVDAVNDLDLGEGVGGGSGCRDGEREAVARGLEAQHRLAAQGEGRWELPSTCPLPLPASSSPSSVPACPSTTGREIWRPIGLNRRTGEDVVMELVIADLDPMFLRACGQPRPHDRRSMLAEQNGVRVVHGPMQQVIADSLREGNGIHTYVVFGTYGYFPANTEEHGLVSGLSKAMIQIFPDSWRSFAEQCGGDEDTLSDMPWMARKGQVWVAEPEIPGALTLVACAAYPRDQHPTEAEAAARRFETALRMIRDSEQEGRATRGGYLERKVRVVTHAMGSFVGHPQVEVFAQGLSEGLRRFHQTSSTS